MWQGRGRGLGACTRALTAHHSSTRPASSYNWACSANPAQPAPPLRRPQELSRRCETLIRLIEKENEDDEERVRTNRWPLGTSQPLTSSAMSAARQHGMLQGALVLQCPTNYLHLHPFRRAGGRPQEARPQAQGRRQPGALWWVAAVWLGWVATHSSWAVHGTLPLSAPWAL